MAGNNFKTVRIDAVFPAMHGTYGEDGSLMGLLRMAGVPFVGCDMSSSSISMDKVFTKQVLESEGIPTVPFVWFTKKSGWTTTLVFKSKFLNYIGLCLLNRRILARVSV